MIARLPLTARIGLGLVLIGVCWYGSWALWAGSRIWAPLKTPISLSQGHIRTAEFRINLEGTYELYVEFKPVFDNGSGAGGLRCPSPPPRTAWSVSEQGQVITSGDGGGDKALGGFFSVTAGRYTLDLDVRDDGSCLNAASPSLVIAAFEYEHPEVDGNLSRAFFLSLLLAVTGLNLFIRSYSARRHQEPACSLTEPGPQPPLIGRDSGPPETGARSNRSAHLAFPARASEYNNLELRRSYVWPFQKAPWFGLIASFVIYPVLLIWICFYLPPAPRGLAVRLLTPEIAAETPRPGAEPLLVRVGSDGRSVVRSLYIGSQRLPPEDFHRALRNGLASRPSTWPVYVEGDPEIDWGPVVKAIDELRGLHAKVVLLTRPTVPSDKRPRSKTVSHARETLQPRPQ